MLSDIDPQCWYQIHCFKKPFIEIYVDEEWVYLARLIKKQ